MKSVNNYPPYQRWLVAFSLSALTFFPAWSQILDGTRYFDYPGFPFDPLAPAVTLFWMVILTPILYGAFHNSLKWVIVTCLLISINGIRLELGLSGIVYGFLSLFILVFAFLYKERFRIILQKGLLIVSPFAFIVSAKALWSLSYLLEPTQDMVATSTRLDSPRIIWMIFDELDPRLAFENRMGIALPNLDSLRSEAVFATHAYAAGSDTIQSIPSMISGLILTDETILNDRNVAYTRLDNKERVDWYQIPNIFEKAHQKGARSAVLGNYHPYYKLLGRYTKYCLRSCVRDESILNHFYETSRLVFYEELLNGIPFIRRLFFGEALVREQHIKCYKHMLKHAKTVCADPDIDFVFIHWPIPHHPGIYNPRTKEFSKEYPSSYFDNLILVDETVGQIAHEMRQVNLWNSSVIIITSDHGLRSCTLETSSCDAFEHDLRTFLRNTDFRVPLLVKMPGQKAPLVFDGKIRMCHLHNMIENIQDKKIHSPEQLASWMQSQGPSFTLAGLESH